MTSAAKAQAAPASNEAESSGTSTIRGDCQWCGYPNAQRTYSFTQLKPLCLHELPLHSTTDDRISNDDRPTLFTFIYNVLKHMYGIDFGDKDKDWVQAGHYPASGTRLDVLMPPLGESAELPREIGVPVQVEKWASDKSNTAWLGRQSYHRDDAIAYSELHELLAEDHCYKESLYTPSVFDTVQLVHWSEQNSQDVARELNLKEPEWKIHSVEMSMYQMFHEMPKALGVSLLQNRVFHVICLTALSEYTATAHGGDQKLRAQSHTVQLPVSFESFSRIGDVLGKSHFKERSRIYDISHRIRGGNADSKTCDPPTARQVKYNGKKVTEGFYGSLERLRHAPQIDPANTYDNCHRWNMITQSDARGITRAAPWSTKKKEILEAVAQDVQYVLEHIRKQRHTSKGVTNATQ